MDPNNQDICVNGSKCMHGTNNCNARKGVYSCSLPRGHEGPHIACKGDHHNLACWGPSTMDGMAVNK